MSENDIEHKSTNVNVNELVNGSSSSDINGYSVVICIILLLIIFWVLIDRFLGPRKHGCCRNRNSRSSNDPENPLIEDEQRTATRNGSEVISIDSGFAELES